MPLDGLCVHALRREMTARLSNGRVFKIFQPWPDTLILHLRVGSTVERLLLSASPQLPSAHITNIQPENPVQAPLFSMVLRKHLEPARLLRIEQVGLDRILHFVFETFDERGQRVERVLIAELMGRQSNVILMDPAEDRVIDALRRGNPTGSGRSNVPGSPYEPAGMSAGAKTDPMTEVPEAFLRYVRLAAGPKSVSRLIMERYDGFGPFAAAEVVQRAGFAGNITRADLSLHDLEALAQAFFAMLAAIQSGQHEPTLFRESPVAPLDSWLLPPTSPHLLIERSSDSMSAIVDMAFAEHNQALRLGRMQSDLLRQLRRAHSRAERKLAERLKEEDASGEAELHKHRGDLLSAYLHEVTPRSDRAVIPDYMNDYQVVEIPLNPLLTPVQNVQSYYRKYQRAKRAANELKTLVHEAKVELSYLNQVMTSIELAESEIDLEDIRQELMQQGWLAGKPVAKRTRHTTARPKPLRFTSSEGHTIWVGRNNRQNDQLTLKQARPTDLWFHTKDIPGSHVILRVDGDASETALHEAAMIAAHYSKARESAQVPVDYVVAKNVRKPAGAPPGYVTYDHHRTLYVTPTRQAVERLRVEPGTSGADDDD